MRAHLTILAILTTSDAIGSPPLIRRLDSRTIHRGEFFFNSVSSNLLGMDRVIADFAAVSREKKENGKKLHEHENRTRQCCQIWSSYIIIAKLINEHSSGRTHKLVQFLRIFEHPKTSFILKLFLSIP